MHIRSQIRTALTELISGLPTCGNYVYASRYWALQGANLPAITIHTPSDTVDQYSSDSYIRRLELLVVIRTMGTANYEQAADDIAQEIEEAIALDRTLNHLCKPLELGDTQMRLEQGEQVICICEMRFTTIYSHARSDSQSPN